jgi:hypothetical protein
MAVCGSKAIAVKHFMLCFHQLLLLLLLTLSVVVTAAAVITLSSAAVAVAGSKAVLSSCLHARRMQFAYYIVVSRL